MNPLQLKIPPPVYLLAFVGLMWLVAHWLTFFNVIPTPWNRLGLVLIGTAILVDFWSLGLFFRAHTTFNPMHPERTEALVTDGPYRYTRNPMYVGMLVILSGWAIYLGNVGAFLLLPLFVGVLNRQQIIPEEQMLEAKFADVYRAYRERVPRWF